VQAQDEFARLGVRIIGISVDQYAVAQEYAQSVGARFPVVGDGPAHAAARAYGALLERYGVYARLTFVIDADRVIRAVIADPHDMQQHSRRALEVVTEIVQPSTYPS
jgi:alkyl hydroperoxide reductase subunit AhpC